MHLGIVDYLLDLVIPKQNCHYSDIHSHLTQDEIETQEASFRHPTQEQIGKLEYIFSCSDYSNPLIADLIHRAKYQGEFSIAQSLASLIHSKTLNASIPKPDLLTFVPPDPKRFNERGYHLPQKIAKLVSQLSLVPTASLLIKARSTPPQAMLKRSERLKNLVGTVRLNANVGACKLPSLTTIWIVDDLTTTGSTLYQCANAIKSTYPFLKIIGVVVSSNQEIDVNSGVC